MATRMVTKLCRIPSHLLRNASKTNHPPRPPKPQLGLRTCLPRDDAARARRTPLPVHAEAAATEGRGCGRSIEDEGGRGAARIPVLLVRAGSHFVRARARSRTFTPLHRPRRTVDLAFILSQFGVRFHFLTRTLGANPAYTHEAFYQPTLDKDTQRVNGLFDAAAKHNIVIQRRSMSPDEMRELVRPHDKLVMALVDRRLLYRASTSTASSIVEVLLTLLRRGRVRSTTSSSRADDARQGYVIKDPEGRARRAWWIATTSTPPAARGTDEDLRHSVGAAENSGWLTQ